MMTTLKAAFRSIRVGLAAVGVGLVMFSFPSVLPADEGCAQSCSVQINCALRDGGCTANGDCATCSCHCTWYGFASCNCSSGGSGGGGGGGEQPEG